MRHRRAAAAIPARRALQDAWEPVLFNQFHDIICGSHVDVVYRATLDRFDFSQELARLGTARGLEELTRRIDTSGDGDVPWSSSTHSATSARMQ